jgi:hypothetical protein
MGAPCPATNPTRLLLANLFSYCPEISAECDRVFPSRRVGLIELEDPDILYHPLTNKVRLRFSIDPDELKLLQVSARYVIRSVEKPRSSYVEVSPAKPGFRTF